MDAEDIQALIEKTANTLRGMTFDPRIPNDTKACMQDLINELEDAAEKLEDCGG